MPHMSTTFEQCVLRNVLQTFAKQHESIGYCQSFSYLGAHLVTLFLTSNPSAPQKILEENCLLVFNALICGLLPEQFYTGRMESLIVDVMVFQDLIKELLPELYSVLFFSFFSFFSSFFLFFFLSLNCC